MKCILVVEDDKLVRESIHKILINENFKVISVSSVDEALNVLDENRLDLIISDIMMEPKNGYDLLDEIIDRKIFPPLPLIFLTAKSEYEDIREGMTRGADDYLVKPFKREELLSSVNIRLKKSDLIKRKFEEISSTLRKNLPHQLRTPLVSIIGFSQIAYGDAEVLDTKSIKHFSGRIYNSAFELSASIEKLLSFSEAVSIRVSPDLLLETKNAFEEIDLGYSIEAAAGERANMKGRLDKLKLEVENIKFKTHSVFFESMLKEVVDNAFKFSPKNSEVKVTGVSSEENYSIIIENESKDMIESNFLQDRYLIGKKEDNSESKGMGLGIMLAKHLSYILGAKLSVEIKENKYIRFLIVLPK